MKPLDFTEVANLINHSRVTEIDLDPIAYEKGRWALYKGTNKVPNFTYQFQILYLYSDFTKASVYPAFQAVSIPGSTQVVYSPSVKESYIDELKKLFRLRQPAGIRDLKSYLFSFVQDKMKTYTEKIKDLKPDFFIDPQYETPSGFKRKVPNPIYSFLTENTEDVSGGALGILLAEPGQGKTHTAKYIAASLSSTSYIPIFIHSPQWFEMREEDLTSLYKTIMHSFRYFNAPIDWVEDHEEEFINIALKLDVFRIIFDGFDEFILWNKGKIPAEDIIKSLNSLTEESNSRILLTSRTSFWNSNIFNEKDYSKLFKYAIEPFDINHAKDFFTKRYPKETSSVTRAIDLFATLKKHGTSPSTDSFIGRGFILSLIADLSSNDTDISTFDGNSSVLEWIMASLCLREEKRQRLPITSSQQLEILRLFAEFKVTGTEPNTSNLRDVISLVCEKLSKEEINNLTGDFSKPGSLNDHPLIIKEQANDRWAFKHEQIEFNLLAEQIILYITEKRQDSINDFFKKIRISGSLLDDLTNVIIEQLGASSDENVVEKHFREAIKSLFSSDLTSESEVKKINYKIMIASKLIYYLLNRICPIGRDKTERTMTLLDLIPYNEFKYLQLNTTLSSLDLTNTTLTYCRFENINWANCMFSQTTTFEHCTFIGGQFHNCEQVGQALFINCEFDKEAESTVSNEQVTSGRKILTTQDIKRDIELFIKKFVPREGLFKSVHSDNLLRGPLGRLSYKNTILEIMEKFILSKHIISQTNSGHGYSILPEAKSSVLNFLNNGVFSGDLAKAFNDICKKLKVCD